MTMYTAYELGPQGCPPCVRSIPDCAVTEEVLAVGAILRVELRESLVLLTGRVILRWRLIHVWLRSGSFGLKPWSLPRLGRSSSTVIADIATAHRRPFTLQIVAIDSRWNPSCHCVPFVPYVRR